MTGRTVALAVLLALLPVSAARAQGVPPPATTTPPAAGGSIEPLTAAPANIVEAPFAAPAPAAPADAPPIAAASAPDDAPIYQRWWFWTAIGAAAVTTIAVLIATSGPSAPRTDFGNMPAF